MHPLLYEINTRCWLRELSVRAGKSITLAEVPDSEFSKWESLGFTHIWLMGIWKAGPRARGEAIRTAEQRGHYLEALPDYQEEDILGSPYAIVDYSVPEIFGNDQALKAFRQKLNQRGLKLILDFVPNHLGLDHPWVVEEPDLFVQSASAAPDTFQQQTSQGLRWLAHGKDPYFPPWTDTVQLDYRRRTTQVAMLELLTRVAERCDGVRCDMAMLLLNNVFAKNWERFPTSRPEPSFEFWESAISTIKTKQRDFLFLAEVYWGLEARLQKMGFDYTYDKELYDRIVSHDPAGIQRHLLNKPIEFVSASAHFLENHDERRVASVLELAEHRAAATLILTLPGLRLLHEGQLTGATRRVPVQLARRFAEDPKTEIVLMYQELLALLCRSLVGQGMVKLLQPMKASETDSTAESVVLIQWSSVAQVIDVVVINLSARASRCVARLTELQTEEPVWKVRNLAANSSAPSREYDNAGLHLELEPFETRWLRLEAAAMKQLKRPKKLK